MHRATWWSRSSATSIPTRPRTGFAARLAALRAATFRRPRRRSRTAARDPRAELRKDRAQAHLVIGFRGLALDDPDREALEVLTQVLSGQSGRLFLELRDRRASPTRSRR